MEPNIRDVPGGDRAVGIDDAAGRNRYRDEPPQHPPEHEEYVTNCGKCGNGDAPAGSLICPECESEEHMEQMMDDRMEMGL